MARQIIYKSPKHIAEIATAGKYLNELLLLTAHNAKAGVSLLELEQQAQQFLDKKNLTGAFKGFHGFPANLCLSVNDCIVHGIPDETVLQDGDLLKIDAGVTYKKGIADSAVSLIIGGKDKNPEGYELYTKTKSALDTGLKFIGPGETGAGFAKAVSNHIKDAGFRIIKNLTGHGVGTSVHEGPSIYNWMHPDVYSYTFRPGMVIALEPITAIYSEKFREDPFNGWNLYTKQGDLGAQWEYTLEITSNGFNILAGITELFQ